MMHRIHSRWDQKRPMREFRERSSGSRFATSCSILKLLLSGLPDGLQAKPYPATQPWPQPEFPPRPERPGSTTWICAHTCASGGRTSCRVRPM